MKHLYKLILSFSLFVPALSQAQDDKRTFNWYFGNSAGVNFSTTPPTPLTDGKMFTYEGCASMSDTNGNLLFYTNGQTIWNKNHVIMDNGDGLNGHQSSTQSSIIIPQPGNDSLFYVFTTFALGAEFEGFEYNIVNMNLNSGLGKVITKNVFLTRPVCEKLTATRHANGRDVWVLVHKFKLSNEFYSYLLTDSGLHPCPVISSIGSIHGTKDVNGQYLVTDAQGDMKFSRDGTKLAVCVYQSSPLNRIDLFDFDKATGQVKNHVPIPNVDLPYSIEFSPNAKVLYCTNRYNYLYQYDLSQPTGTAIRNSQVQLYWSGDIWDSYHCMLQIGPDKRIYIALVDSAFLSVIQNPDSLGTACGFQMNGLNLGGKTSEYGLPNFLRSYLHQPKLDFGYQQSCTNNTIPFNIKAGSLSGVKWYFKQTGTGKTDSSLNISPVHTFSDTGWYSVTLRNATDTVSKNIYIAPATFLGADIIECRASSYLLTTPPGYRCWQWNTGSDSSSAIVTQTGTYTVSAYNLNSCLVRDTVKVGLFPTPQLKKPLADSILFCTGKTITLAPDSGVNFHWQDGYTKAIRTVDTAGIFYTYFTDSNGCYAGDTIRLQTFQINKPSVQRLLDSLWVTGPYTQWQWKRNAQNISGAIQPTHKATQNGYYQIQVRDTGSCTVTSDSLAVLNVGIKPTQQNESYLNIYPNPVTDLLTVSSSLPGSLTLLDLAGKTVLHLDMETGTQQLSLVQLPRGCYLLHFQSRTLNTYTKLLLK